MKPIMPDESEYIILHIMETDAIQNNKYDRTRITTVQSFQIKNP